MTEDIQRIKISRLPPASTIVGLFTIGVNTQGHTVRVSMEILRGAKGDPFVFSDFTPEQIELLKVKGDRGKPFTYEDFTPSQLESLKVKGDPFLFSDFTPEQIEVLKVKGDPFLYADFTAEQIQNLKQPAIDAAATAEVAKQAAIDAAAYAVQEGDKLAAYVQVTTEEYSPIDYPEI